MVPHGAGKNASPPAPDVVFVELEISLKECTVLALQEASADSILCVCPSQNRPGISWVGSAWVALASSAPQDWALLEDLWEEC